MSDATNDPPIDVFVAVNEQGIPWATRMYAGGGNAVAPAILGCPVPDSPHLGGHPARRLVDVERLSDALERAESAEAEIDRLRSELASLRSLHADHLKASAEFRGEALRRATERRAEYERVCEERDEATARLERLQASSLGEFEGIDEMLADAKDMNAVAAVRLFIQVGVGLCRDALAGKGIPEAGDPLAPLKEAMMEKIVAMHAGEDEPS